MKRMSLRSVDVGADTQHTFYDLEPTIVNESSTYLKSTRNEAKSVQGSSHIQN